MVVIIAKHTPVVRKDVYDVQKILATNNSFSAQSCSHDLQSHTKSRKTHDISKAESPLAENADDKRRRSPERFNTKSNLRLLLFVQGISSGDDPIFN